MKKFAVMSLAISLATTVLAQQPKFQGTHPLPKLPLVNSVTPPAVLHTGRPLTTDEKLQFLATAARTAAARKRTPAVKSSPAAPTTITPDQMSIPLVIWAEGYNIGEANWGEGAIYFNSGPSSYLNFNLYVKPDTAYIVTMKVSTGGTPAPMSVFTSIWGPTGANAGVQSIPVSPVGDIDAYNDFAYSFTIGDNTSGIYQFGIFCPTAGWTFLSAEVTSVPY